MQSNVRQLPPAESLGQKRLPLSTRLQSCIGADQCALFLEISQGIQII